MSKFFILSIVFTFQAATLQLFAATPLQKAAKNISGSLEEAKIKRVAVLPFETKLKDNTATLVQERLITYLVKTKKVTVVERSQLNKILREKKLQQTGLLDEKTSNEIGKLLGVEALIAGSITAINNGNLEINARAIAAKTAKIVTAENLQLNKNWGERAVVTVDNSPQAGPLLGKPLVQIAILLDTSSSMDGLITQTKTQIWKIINELARAEKDGNNPDIEVAIYEYGNDRLKREEGFIRQVNGFSSDLDKVSESLFSLTTNGGSEYAGKVIQEAISGLTWKKHSDVYKVIFIAGNEPFTQGPVPYKAAIEEARKKGVVVNTIFCGRRQQGKATGWHAGAIVGGGEFMNIQHHMKVVRIQAPQDQQIEKLGNNINRTFVPYGSQGANAYRRQSSEDKKAKVHASSGASVERAVFKAQKQYGNSNKWDLVSLIMNKKLTYDKIDRKKLPKHLQKKSKKEIRAYIEKRIAERKNIQKKIKNLNKDRRKYIAQEEKKRSKKGAPSLDDAMLDTIHKQAEAMDYSF